MKHNLQPLGRLISCVVEGFAPDEMGIGPVPTVLKLLRRCGLQVGDIGLWELNEAFASQVVHCIDTLGIPIDRLNVNGGAIALGHPYGTRIACASCGARMLLAYGDEIGI